MQELLGPWPWYIAGPLIGLFVPALLIVSNKMLGISTALLHFCSLALPKGKQAVLEYNSDEHAWKFYFVIGIVIGGYIAVTFLTSSPVRFLPEQYHTVKGIAKLFAGGLLVGFGTRYANGCTSGHSIFGLSLLQVSSLKATLAFFAGGLLYTVCAMYF